MSEELAAVLYRAFQQHRSRGPGALLSWPEWDVLPEATRDVWRGALVDTVREKTRREVVGRTIAAQDALRDGFEFARADLCGKIALGQDAPALPVGPVLEAALAFAPEVIRKTRTAERAWLLGELQGLSRPDVPRDEPLTACLRAAVAVHLGWLLPPSWVQAAEEGKAADVERVAAIERVYRRWNTDPRHTVIASLDAMEEIRIILGIGPAERTSLAAEPVPVEPRCGDPEAVPVPPPRGEVQ